MIPYIDELVSLTCAATAATPANTSPTPASEAPSANDPSAGWSIAIIESATSSPSSNCTAVTTPSATAIVVKRPTGAAPTSSLRPVCSSCRVWRPTKNMLISATIAAPKPPICHAMSPPTVSRLYGGPTIAIRPGLPLTVAS